MSVVVRGAKNAFRNGLRTSAVALILAISIGLSLSMLVANKAVEGRIADLKTQVSRTITINPAGARGMEGGGEPLTSDDLAKVEKVAHVSSASATVTFRLQTEGQNETFSMRGPGGSDAQEMGQTNLESGIDAGTLGRRFNGVNSESGSTNSDAPQFKLPITALGTNGTVDESGKDLSLTDGRLLKSDDTYSAVVGKVLAEKNSLKVGSTFTAYDKTFTVVGIVDQGSEFANNMLIVPLATAQELTGQSGEISSIVAQADSIDNLDTVVADIQSTLGTDHADVSSSQDNIRQAIDSLKSVQSISIIGFIAALSAAALTVLMVMFMIVRERKREIGVLKAIGGSNRTIVTQFVVEAVVLVAIGGIVGLGTAFVGSGAIANALVSSSTSSSSQSSETEATTSSEGPRMGGGMMRFHSSGDNLKDTSELVGKVTTSIGASTLLYGFLGMIAIAIVGSAIPAWLIAKVRPAEVLRGE